MTEERLLKRIVYWQSPEDAERRRADIGAYTESVYADISNLFNTRRGSLPHLPGFGLPDITEIYSDIPDSVMKLRKSLREAVEQGAARRARRGGFEQGWKVMAVKVRTDAPSEHWVFLPAFALIAFVYFNQRRRMRPPAGLVAPAAAEATKSWVCSAETLIST